MSFLHPVTYRVYGQEFTPQEMIDRDLALLDCGYLRCSSQSPSWLRVRSRLRYSRTRREWLARYRGEITQWEVR